MGQKIAQRHFSQEDFVQFRTRLISQLGQLKHLIAKPNFGQQPLMFGAELELYLVDKQANAIGLNQQVLDKLADPLFQHEINQYNIELNLLPVPMQGQPFTQLLISMQAKLAKLNKVTTELGVQTTAIGILPSLTRADLNGENMTDQLRYHLLSERLAGARNAPFKIEIHGEDDINMQVDDVTAEGANTSFQVHMMVPHHSFSRVFNAALISQPLVTAIAANSPIFLHKKIWQETRIALLKQVLDCRLPDIFQHKLPARVNLGCGWVNQNAWQVYAQAVALYPVLLPYLSEPSQDELSQENENRLAPLTELCLHMGTVWHWNRPVYSAENNGHIRIELRALPAGPTNLDMLANAAFAIGLAYGLRDLIDDMIAIMPFDFANHNFYRAAQAGLNAQIMWPNLNQFKLEQQNVSQLIRQMLPVAKQGLLDLNIDLAEAELFLGVIEHRLNQGMTGAYWQLETVKYYQKKYTIERACQLMLHDYMQFSASDVPVANWRRIWT